MIKVKYVLGGLLLIVSLFLASYGSDYDTVYAVNHPFDLEPYNVSYYWMLNALHVTPLIYLIVFVFIKVEWGFIKWLFLIVEVLKYADFYLFYNDVLLDSHAVGLCLTLAISAYILKKVIN